MEAVSASRCSSLASNRLRRAFSFSNDLADRPPGAAVASFLTPCADVSAGQTCRDAETEVVVILM